MSDVTSKDVLERLKTVRGPDMTGNIVDLGMVSEVFISDGKAYFSITVLPTKPRISSRCGLPPSGSSRTCPA